MSDEERVDMGVRKPKALRHNRDMVVTMSEYLRLPFLSGMTIEAGEALTEQNVIPQHTTTPLMQLIEESVNAAAKRKAEKNRELEGAGGSEGSSKRHKEKSSDHIPCPTPLRTVVAVASDVSRGDNVISPTQTQGDNLLEIPAHDSANTTTRLYEEHHDEHSGVLERVVIETESIPTAATRPDNGKSIAQEETPMPDPLPKGVGADGAGSSLPPPLFVPTWDSPEEPSDHSGGVLAWFSLARGAMAQAHTLCQFESLYDTHHALQESSSTTRSIATPEEHAQCSEGLAVVRAEKNSLMATNAEQVLRIKELEQQLKSVDEVHSSAVKDLESQLAQKDSALVYAERISGERLSENEGLRAQLAFAQKEKTDAIRKLLPTVVERLLQSHEYKQSLSVPFNFALQTGWGQGLAEERSEKELHKIMMRMNGFDPYSDKKMTAEYERLFSKTYLYVDRISHLSEKPMQDLLKLHPAPPPKDAPKAGFRSIALPPNSFRAAGVAGLKNTSLTRRFQVQRLVPLLKIPASKLVFCGVSKPPSKKYLSFVDLEINRFSYRGVTSSEEALPYVQYVSFEGILPFLLLFLCDLVFV
ncbi:hypothetical protein Tco_0915810 [Tanacetum coccineum]